MALISQNFKNDTKGTSLSIRPIILLANRDLETGLYIPIDIYSVNNESIQDHTGNNLQVKGILDNISSIKNSIDYDKKKLKVNTFRFTLFNYLDANTKLTNSDNYSVGEDNENPLNHFIGKYVILYYQTNSANSIDLKIKADVQDDKSLNILHSSILFNGVVNRLEHDEKTIKIQAEDDTQLNIEDKIIPKSTVDELGNIKRRLSKQNEDDLRIPIVYGKVDRAKALTYTMKGKIPSIGNLPRTGFIHDSRPIKGIFKSRKTRQTYYKTLTLEAAPYNQTLLLKNMFFKGSSDWLIFPYGIETDSTGATTYLEDIYSDYSTEIGDETIFMGTYEAFDVEGLIGLGVEFPISILKDSVHYNSILDQGQDYLVSDYQEPDDSLLLNNEGYEKNWWRESDPFFADGPISQSIYLPAYYGADYSPSLSNGDGRWVIYEFGNKRKISSFYQKMHMDISDEAGTNTAIPHRIFAKPLSVNNWSYLQMTSSGLGSSGLYYILYNHSGDDSDESGWWHFTTGEDEGQRQRDGAVFHFKNSPDWFPEYTGELYATNKVILFEYYVNGDYPNSDYQPNLSAGQNANLTLYNNNYSMYEEELDDFLSKDAHFPVEGRVSYSSTQPLALSQQLYEYENYWQQTVTPENITLQQIIQGSDNTIPSDFNNIVAGLEEYFTSKTGLWIGDANVDNDQYMVDIPNFFSGELIEDWEGYIWNVENPESLFGYITNEQFLELEDNLFKLDDGGMLRTRIILYAIQNCYRKIMINSLEKEAFNYVNQQVANGQEISPSFPTTNDFLHNEGDEYWSAQLLMIMYDSDELREMFTNIWNNEYVEIRRSFFRRVLKYLYLNNLNQDSTSDSLFQSLGGDNYQYEWDSIITNDVGDLIPSEEISLDKWGEFFYIYLEDTLGTINKAIYDYQSATAYQPDQSSYVVWAEPRHELYIFSEVLIYGQWHSSSGGDAFDYWQENTWDTGATFGDIYTETSLYGDDLEALRNFQYGLNLNLNNLTTSIFVEKPTDIVLDILLNEMDYGASDLGYYSEEYYDIESIERARIIYDGWKMGFSIDKSTDGKKLLENLLKETKSFFSFTPDGRFTFVTLKDKYAYNDIQHFVDKNDVIKYKIKKTKRENVVTESKCNYRYDNGYNNYMLSTNTLKASDLLAGYDGYNYYNLDETNGYKERDLRYHTDTPTVNLYHKHYLLNNCNQHLIITMELPLSYGGIKVSDILNIGLIGNTKAFGLDYSKVEILNGQPIYPAWITTSVDIRIDKIIVEAHQLHYLGTDGQHGFIFPEDDVTTAYAVIEEFNHLFPEIINYNYLPEESRNPDYNYVHVTEWERPYGDITGNGNIDIIDLIDLINHILEIDIIDDLSIIDGYNFGTNTVNTTPDPVNAVKIVQLVNIIFGN